ncbi:MAG: AAA family ATPase [Alphaproteobacteria bacterium]|nr:AAA family ATPase [Alphaproteobacteria bacterium]
MSGADLDPAVLELMGDPETYSGGVDGVERVETHAARVFLAGDRAYKIKKPVDLGFLDFSTVEARRTALVAELALNRPAAPQLYRRLIWITREDDGALALAGGGEPVEPVLEMTRFDQDLLLDRLALKGEVDGALARDLADAVFDSHERAEVSTGSGADRIRTVLFKAAERCRREQGAPVRRIDVVSKALNLRLTEHGALLDARARSGFLRRCHGDLHLKNIVLLDGRPVLFDALEFDEALATIDTLYDLAFLIMDLVHRGLERSAAALISQYAARLDSQLAVEGLALLPAFCGVRALIKAMVCLERGGHGDGEEAQAYLSLAERCAQPVFTRLVGVGGLSGTGKSTLAEALAPALGPPPGALVIRADLERKVLEGVSWRSQLPRSAYTRDASRRVYDRQREKAAWALCAGLPVVMDAVHSRPEERAALEQVSADADASFLGLWLDAGAQVIRARVASRRNDPSDADLEVVDKQADYDAGEIGWIRINASDGAEAVLSAARRAAGLA